MPAGRSRTWISLAYLIAGIAFVVGSNYVMSSNADLPPTSTRVSGAWQGVLFVLVVVAILYCVVQRAQIATLQHAHEELQKKYGQLEDRLRERTQELERLEGIAGQSNRVKTAFLTMMSHELLTPLNSILGFTEIILEGHSGPLTEVQKGQLRIVQDSSTHLRALIENVLDITRIEAGEVSLEFASVDMPSLVARIMQSFETEAARKGLQLQLHADAATPTVYSDAKRLRQIVTHLLANAIKFTADGVVTVELGSRAGGLEMSVADTGIGIAAEALPGLFKPFSQVAQAGGRLLEGTGLSLAISRDLARALGGDLVVESVQGRGSRFTLTLPLRAPASSRANGTDSGTGPDDEAPRKA
jgi:signal transduction histidine kinase